MGITSSKAALIQKLYEEIGGNPSEIFIEPSDDDTAVGYRVMKDGKRVTITRLDIQDQNFLQIKTILNRLL